MSAKSCTSWFWSDWAGDQEVRRLTMAERGMWIDLLCLAAVGTPKGYVTDRKGRPLPVDAIAEFARCSSAEASELIRGVVEKGAASRDRAGRIFNRRTVRDEERSAKKRRAGILGGQANALRLQQFREIEKNLPRHLLKQANAPPSVKSVNDSAETSARARPQRETAPPVQAEPQQGQPLKRVSEMSKADLEAKFATMREARSKPRQVLISEELSARITKQEGEAA